MPDLEQETSGLRLPVWDRPRDRTNSVGEGQRPWCRRSHRPAGLERLERAKGNDDSEQVRRLPRHRSRFCEVVCGACCDADVEIAENRPRMSRQAAREEVEMEE